MIKGWKVMFANTLEGQNILSLLTFGIGESKMWKPSGFHLKSTILETFQISSKSMEARLLLLTVWEEKLWRTFKAWEYRWLPELMGK